MDKGMNERELAAFTRSFRETATAAKGINAAMPVAQESIREATGNLPRSTSLSALVALARTGKHVYGGTVPAETVARRRASGRVARRQRRVNRLRGFRKGVR